MTNTAKLDFIDKINQKWKNEQQCFDEAKVTGKDSRTGKPTTISWPREKPQDQRKYETWKLELNRLLQNVVDIARK